MVERSGVARILIELVGTDGGDDGRRHAQDHEQDDDDGEKLT